MGSNTKIIVLRSKELVYALVLLIVSVLIIMVAVSLFMPSESNTGTPSTTSPSQMTGKNSSLDTYVPGIYSSTLQLGSSNVELQITVDKNHINSINLTNIDESIATLYPLMNPTLEELATVILKEQSIDSISYTTESRYTSMLLMQAISSTLDKARASENADREMGTLY